MARASVELEGVPETLLWTLYHRASEARRPDAVLEDPKGVELLGAIDFPFAERFGPATAGLSQWQALRARRFDVEVRRFLASHPDGMVVALGEGLETQFWRVDNGSVRSLTVDLPEAIAVRERLLPRGERAGGRRALGARPALDGRGRGFPGPADRGPGAVHVLRVRGRRASRRRVREALPRKRAGLRRGAALAQRGQPPWKWGLDRETRGRLGRPKEMRLPHGAARSSASWRR